MNQIVSRTALVILNVFSYALVFRCICSWIPQLSNSSVGNFIYSITEPVVAPVRRLLYRLIPSLERLPIDLSVLTVFLIIDFLMLIIYRI